MTFDEENYIWKSNVNAETQNMLASACMDNFRIHYFLYSNAINLFLFSLYALQWNKWLACIFAPFSILLAVGGRYYFDDQISKNYYTIFKYQVVSDEYKMQPVRAAGKGIAIYLLEDAQNDYSSYRMQAIQGLGLLKYKPAISSLHTILQDSSEQIAIRKEAYKALKAYKIPITEKLTADFLNHYQDTDGEILKMELAQENY